MTHYKDRMSTGCIETTTNSRIIDDDHRPQFVTQIRLGSHGNHFGNHWASSYKGFSFGAISSKGHSMVILCTVLLLQWSKWTKRFDNLSIHVRSVQS